MAIQVYCVCGRELAIPGALLFSPPDPKDRCSKRHLCDRCYRIVAKVVQAIEDSEKDARPCCSECGWIGTLDHHLSPNGNVCPNTGRRATRLRIDSSP